MLRTSVGELGPREPAQQLHSKTWRLDTFDLTHSGEKFCSFHPHITNPRQEMPRARGNGPGWRGSPWGPRGIGGVGIPGRHPHGPHPMTANTMCWRPAFCIRRTIQLQTKAARILDISLRLPSFILHILTPHLPTRPVTKLPLPASHFYSIRTFTHQTFHNGITSER